MGNIYLHFDGERHGPYERDDVIELWRSAQLPASATYYDEASGQWHSVLLLVNPGAAPPPPLKNIKKRSRKPASFVDLIAPKRPTTITILCYVKFIFLGLSVFTAMSMEPDMSDDPGLLRWLQTNLLVNAGVQGVAWWAIFRMRRWGALLYLAWTAYALYSIWEAGLWSNFTLIEPVVFAFFVVYYFRDMRW